MAALLALWLWAAGVEEHEHFDGECENVLGLELGLGPVPAGVVEAAAAATVLQLVDTAEKIKRMHTFRVPSAVI